MTNVTIIPEIKRQTRTFSTHTLRGTVIEISYLDIETPVVKAATMVMDENKPCRKIRSLRKLIYRSRRFQQWCDKMLMEYLKLTREKLLDDLFTIMHAEVFGEPTIDVELYSGNSRNHQS